MKLKIVHLTSVHPVNDSRILYKECKTLKQAGHEVVLVAPHGHHDDLDGVRVHAVPKPGTRWQRLWGTIWQVYRAAKSERGDIYHFHDPELIPVGLLLRFQRRRVIYDVHEDLPRQIANKPWIPRYLRTMTAALAECVEQLASRFFTAIIGATPTIAARFQAGNTVVVQNFPVAREFAASATVPYSERPAQVAYIGGISIVRGAFDMVEAMGRLPTELDVYLSMAGDFKPTELEDRLRNMDGSRRVRLLGWQSRESVSQLLGHSRVGLVVLHPIPNYVVSYPVKLFEYMAAGVPVIASDFPLWRKIIEEAQCGILVDPQNPQHLADAITTMVTQPELAQRMGENGRKAVLENYTWDVEARKLLELYSHLAAATK